jgi:hypothetical protein
MCALRADLDKTKCGPNLDLVPTKSLTKDICAWSKAKHIRPAWCTRWPDTLHASMTEE